MKTLRTSFMSTGYHLYYSLTNPKIWAALLMILAAVFLRINPYSKIAADYNETVSIGIISYLFSDVFSVTIIYAALLFIFSELPFDNPQQIFLVTRSGKRAWCVSQFLYIIAVSLFVTLLISVFTVILLSGHLSFENSWGKVINTVIQSDELSEKYQIYDCITTEAVNTFTPHKALVWSVLSGTLTFVVFGSLIYTFNSISHKTAGIIFGVLLIACHMFTGYFANLILFLWFAPLEWSSIMVININHISKMPTPEYAICMLAGLFVLSAGFAIFRSQKKSDIL